MNGTTEFLAKSLVGAGVFLAIPAAGIMLLAIIVGGIYLPFLQLSAAASTCALFAFCLLGFFLLFRTIRFVRTADRTPSPLWLWPAATIYLFIIVGAGATWLLQSYAAARAGEWRDWGGDTMEPDLLVVPAIALLLPIWAAFLSSTLWVRYALNRNA